MQDNSLKLKNNNSFLIIIIVILLLLCTLIFSGCAFLAWKSYPAIYLLLMDKNSASQKNDNNEPKNDNKIPEKVFVPVKDEVAENITTTYYDISGFTSEELRNQMGTLGPEMTSNERVYAMANNWIDWTLPMKTAEGCTEVETEVNVEYIMPRWTNYAEATLDMQQRWDTFYALLEKHENEHGEIAKQEADKYLAEIKNIKDYSSCQDFDDKVYPIHEKYLLEIAQMQENFDNETNHGVNEGVILY